MSIEVQESQDNFLRQGGCFQIGLAYLRKQGQIPRAGQTPFHEYPKMLRFSEGFQEFQRQTLTCDKETVKWTEKREVFRDIVVYDEREEERLLAGGKTSAQIEEERQTLIRRCTANNISVDPSWTSVRLRRELGDAMDAPPADEMGALTAKLAQLKQMAAMRAEIAALEAQLAGSPADDPEEMRAALVGLGVKVDRRWSTATLREELDRATAPVAA